MTSATGRFAVLFARLRWICSFQAECANDRSISLNVGGRSIPISKRNSRSRASSPRKAGASSTYVIGEMISPRSAYLSRASAEAMPKFGSCSSTSSMTHVSTTILTIFLPLEVRLSIQQLFEVCERLMRNRAWLLHPCAQACGQLLLHTYNDLDRGSTKVSSQASIAWIRGLLQGLRPDRAQLPLLLMSSCYISYIMSVIMSIEKGSFLRPTH